MRNFFAFNLSKEIITFKLFPKEIFIFNLFINKEGLTIR